MFVGKMGEAGSRRPPTAWVPWHSLQEGALRSFRARSCPWMLKAYCCPASAWQEAQSTEGFTVSQGRTREALTPEWHCEQDTFAWREVWSAETSTKSERPSALASRPLFS